VRLDDDGGDGAKKVGAMGDNLDDNATGDGPDDDVDGTSGDDQNDDDGDGAMMVTAQ
jgi:hypothetical protein